MSYPTTELRTAANDIGVRAIIDTAVATVAPQALTLGGYYVVRTATGIEHVDLTGDRWSDAPARKRGITVVRDARSFAAFWDKHSEDSSEVYADADQLTVTAVLNADGPAAADWGDHRLRLELRETDAWKQWAAHDGKLLPQEAFAEFIEDHLPEILEPAAAEMLEIAQSIQATTSAEFQSGTRLATGERQFKFVEQTTTKAGQRGDLTIPETFVIGLVPFEGSEGYKITARLRYRIVDAHLRMGYKLDRPQDVRKKAFEDVVSVIDGGIEATILSGTPAGR
jgi:uncharacterized protein YfdQ (DUF2303 family)